MKKILFENELFELTKSGEYLSSKIKNYPKSLSSMTDGFYHSDMKEFESFKNRFSGVYEILKNKSENAWFITCRASKYLDCISCEIDVRHRLTNEEAANVVLSSFEEKRKNAIKRIKELVSKGDDISLRGEEEVDNLAKEFLLEDMFKEHIGSPKFKARFNDLLKSTENVLDYFKKHNI